MFYNNVLIDIREYYDVKEPGGPRPGKKGISLTVSQWKKLKEAIDIVDDQIDSLGH